MRPPLSSLCQTTAVSIATILGTGILGLPVSLHSSGIRPFLFTFTLNLFAQLGVVIAAVELLQRAHGSPSSGDVVDDCQANLQRPYVPLANEDTSPSETLSSPRPTTAPAPSLHSLAKHFLPRPAARATFNAIVVAHFLFILSAYALAGPQALSALIPMLRYAPWWSLPTAFVLAGAAAVTCFEQALLPPLTLGTLVKAVLLTVLVLVIFIRGLAIRQAIVDDWHPQVLIDPFLMGTFALNGVVNLMPVTFQACLDGTKGVDGRVPPLDRAFVRGYRMATIVAIVVCYVLNVTWCFAVLLCVPQRSRSLETTTVPLDKGRQIVSTFFSSELESIREVYTNASLTEASELGQISTIPLIEVLEAKEDQLDWVIALLVNIFIALSVTISFLVMSLGMKHFIDGQAQSQSTPSSRFGYDTNRRFKYVLHFAVILTTAVGNPTALFKIMEGVTALSLNMEAGLFVLYMLYSGRSMTKEIPAPLSRNHFVGLVLFVGLYFGSAVLIDLVFYLPSAFT